MTNPKLQSGARTLFLLVLLCGGAGLVAWNYLGKTSPDGAATTADLIQAAESGDAADRKLALQRLQPADPSETDAAIASAERALTDQDPEIRVEAALALARFATSAKAGRGPLDAERAGGVARILLVAFRDDADPNVRVTAANGLASIHKALARAGGPAANPPADDPLKPETLVAALDAVLLKDPANRVALVTVIEQLGPVSMDAPPGLVSALDDPTHFVRGQVLQALSHFSGGVDRAVPVLLSDVATNIDRFQPDYAGIAAAMRPSPAAVPALLEGLKSDNGIVRETAASLLARVAPPPRSAAPAVIAAVKKALAAGSGPDDDEDVPLPQPAASKGVAPSAGLRPSPPSPGSVSPGLAIALARVAPPEESVPLLLQLLKRRSPASRSAAAEGLAEIGPAAHPAIPTLIATLKDALKAGGRSGGGYGSRAARALGRIAPQAPEARSSVPEVVAALSDALKAGSGSIRSSAARALEEFGPKAAPAIPGLKELSGDRSESVREAAESALRRIEPSSAPDK